MVVGTVSATVTLGVTPIEVWPADQKLEPRGHPAILSTRFTDTAEYHPRLIARVLELEQHKNIRRRYFQGACGTKVHHVERWGCSEADLLQARAKEMYRRALNVPEAVVDLSWASIYRAGDYCMAHSHVRSTASIVYCLDPGEEDSDDSVNGRFCFVDPRLPCCCQDAPECMTTPFLPGLSTGTMLIFPSQLVHAVNPYGGARPRITLSWNLNSAVLPGSPLPPEAGA